VGVHLELTVKERHAENEPIMKMAIIISGVILAFLLITALVIAGITTRVIKSKEEREASGFRNPIRSSSKIDATTLNSVSIKIYGQVGLSVKDPFGQTMEIDSYGNVSPNIIPSSYSCKIGQGAESDCKEFYVNHAESGYYGITVNDAQGNIPAYTMEIHARNYNYERLTKCYENIPYFPGIPHKYFLYYNSDNMRGSFIKGGYATDNKNNPTFLTYANLIAPTIILPAGTSAFSLIIFYDLAIIPETFKARFNDMIISNLFRRNPGGWDIVTINLKDGDNLLALSVDGIGMDQIKTHSDDFLIVADLQERKNMPLPRHDG